jgi:hypothetical protein
MRNIASRPVWYKMGKINWVPLLLLLFQLTTKKIRPGRINFPQLKYLACSVRCIGAFSYRANYKGDTRNQIEKA